MIPPKYLLTLLVAGLLPLAVCPVTSAQESAAANYWERYTTDSADVLTRLNKAYNLLAQTDRDYDGYRVRAMENIRWVIVKLGGHVTKENRQTNKVGKGAKAKTSPDQNLRTAMGILEQVQLEVGGWLLVHVNRAGQDIDAALSSSP